MTKEWQVAYVAGTCISGGVLFHFQDIRMYRAQKKHTCMQRWKLQSDIGHFPCIFCVCLSKNQFGRSSCPSTMRMRNTYFVIFRFASNRG